jgi:hypothetical protein
MWPPILNWVSDSRLTRAYREAGEAYGDAVSYLTIAGPCVGFDRLRARFSAVEREYAARGFRTVPLADFVEAGGYGRDIGALIGVERPDGEEVVLYGAPSP